jgi:hypothetical protein
MFAGLNYKTRFGLAIIIAVMVKVILSVILQTGFDTIPVVLNGVFFASGIVLTLWGLYEKEKDGAKGNDQGDRRHL